MPADPELQALLLHAARTADQQGEVVRIVADGVVWQGRLVGPTVWAAVQAKTPSEGDILRDRAEADTTEADTTEEATAYVHFAVASFFAGTEWHRARGARIAIDSVSAWWRHAADD